MLLTLSDLSSPVKIFLCQRVHFRLLANYMALPFKSKINHKDTKNTKFFLEIFCALCASVVNPYLEPVKGRCAFVVPRASCQNIEIHPLPTAYCPRRAIEFAKGTIQGGARSAISNRFEKSCQSHRQRTRSRDHLSSFLLPPNRRLVMAPPKSVPAIVCSNCTLLSGRSSQSPLCRLLIQRW